MRFKIVAVFAVLALLAPTLSGGGVRIRDLRVDVGTVIEGEFVEIPDRVFRRGDVIALRVEALIAGVEGVRYSMEVSVELVHPLGFTMLKTSRVVNSTLEEAGDKWVFYFSFEAGGEFVAGYYEVKVEAIAAGSERKVSRLFFYLSNAALETFVEVEYSVKVRGNAHKLIMALPNDPLLHVSIGPLITPEPDKVVHDSLGNAYAVYEGLREDFEARVYVAGVQRLTLMNADAPLGAPVPEVVARFLEPSEYVECSHPDIVSLAGELVKGAKTYREALARIADYVSSEIEYDASVGELPNSWKLGALWTLHARKGSCLQLARLFTALARAAGIPARVVEGLNPELRPGFTHAYVEVYVPGYGWIPVEPQWPGKMVGVTPPAPGYVALVRGMGERVRLEKREVTAAAYYVVYTGAPPSTTFTQSVRLRPASPLSQLRVKLSVPATAYYGDSIEALVSTEPAGALCEVEVRAPSGWRTLLTGCTPRVIELNETGNWLIEVFAAKPGYVPASAGAVVSVKRKPLNLYVKVEPALIGGPKLVVGTQPPVGGARVVAKASVCGLEWVFILETESDGRVEAWLGPFPLPCPVRVEASTSLEGYVPASARLEAIAPPSIEALAVVLLAAAAIVRVARG